MGDCREGDHVFVTWHGRSGGVSGYYLPSDGGTLIIVVEYDYSVECVAAFKRFHLKYYKLYRGLKMLIQS